MNVPRAYQLANDSELRMLLAFTEPPQAGHIAAINGSIYTVEIASSDNAEVEAVALDGFTYEVSNVVYIMQASNAPDSGVIIGRYGATAQLGIGTSSDNVFHAEDAVGGFAVASAASIAGTEQTLLSACVLQAVVGDILVADGTTFNAAVLTLAVPGSSYNSQDVAISGTTVQFRLYATGDLKVVRTVGSGTPSAILRALYI